MKILIKNVRLLTMDHDYTQYDQAVIIVEDNLICDYGSVSDIRFSALSEKKFDKVIDGKGAIAMPGMVNTHTHLGMIPFRSLGDDTPDRLTRFLFPLEHACMTKDLAYHSAKYAIAEMQLAGVTTFFDMYYFENDIAQATDEMQARAILAESVIDKSPDSDANYGGLAYSEEFIPKWLNHDRIIPAIAPHAPYTNTDESLIAASQIARKYKVPFSIHLSEMTFEMTKYQELYQETPVAYLNRLGVLDAQTLAAHCIFITDDDIKLLQENDVSVAHCIGANTKSAKGIAPLQAMLAAGLKVGLGTDGPSSGNTLDLFTQMRMVANFHKTHLQNRAAFPARDIVRLATLGGAEALGLDMVIGSIERGKKADIVLVETESANMFPIFDPYSTLVYSANASNVSYVLVDGNLVVDNKQLLTASVTDLRENLDQEMSCFRKKAIEFSQDL